MKVWVYRAYRDNGKENGNYYIIIGYIGAIYGDTRDNGEKMEITVVYWGYIGVM